jgi:hypothetical protein
MNAGQFATLAQVLDHYNRAPAAPAGHSELQPLRLKARELKHLEAFLHSLTGLPHPVRQAAWRLSDDLSGQCSWRPAPAKRRTADKREGKRTT